MSQPRSAPPPSASDHVGAKSTNQIFHNIRGTLLDPHRRQCSSLTVANTVSKRRSPHSPLHEQSQPPERRSRRTRDAHQQGTWYFLAAFAVMNNFSAHHFRIAHVRICWKGLTGRRPALENVPIVEAQQRSSLRSQRLRRRPQDSTGQADFNNLRFARGSASLLYRSPQVLRGEAASLVLLPASGCDLILVRADSRMGDQICPRCSWCR